MRETTEGAKVRESSLGRDDDLGEHYYYMGREVRKGMANLCLCQYAILPLLLSPKMLPSWVSLYAPLVLDPPILPTPILEGREQRGRRGLREPRRCGSELITAE